MCVLSIVLSFVFCISNAKPGCQWGRSFPWRPFVALHLPFSTPHNHKTLYFVFCILYFVFCNLYFKCSPPPSHSVQPQDCSNSKANTRTKNSIITSWPLMIIHKIQEKNILRKKLYCFTIFRTFRQGSVSQGRVPVDVEGVSSNK